MRLARFAIFVAITAAMSASLASTAFAKNCAQVASERNQAISEHRSAVDGMTIMRGQLSDMDTNDPAVIDREFNRLSVIDRTWRRKFDSATPDERKLFGPFVKVFDDGVDFWRSKKTAILSGGITPVSGGELYRAQIVKRLSQLQSIERSRSKELAKLQEEVQHCGTGERSGHAPSSSKWNGTYTSGAYTMVVSGGFGSLQYTADRPDDGGNTTDHTTGKCTVARNVATCTDDGTYKDSDKTVERKSTVTLTLYGNTIFAKSKVLEATVTLASGQACPDPAQCTGLHAGAEFESTWTKKP